MRSKPYYLNSEPIYLQLSGQHWDKFKFQYIYTSLFSLPGACSVISIYFLSTFWNDFYFFWTTFNSNSWTCCRLKHFFRTLEPSFLISLFPQKNIRQFKDEFIEVNVTAYSSAFTVLIGILSSWFKICANIPKTTTVDI